jgi:hypothetical protein
MNASIIDQTINEQESLRLQATTERQIADDQKAFKYGKVKGYDLTLGLWTIEVEASEVKARYQGNTAIAIGEVIHYYKAQGQNYGYIRTMPRA